MSLLLLFAGGSAPPTAITRQQVLGGNAKTAGTTTTLSLVVGGGDDPVVGDCVVVHCARDNKSGTGDPFDDTMSDGLGNYYHPVKTNTSGSGTGGLSHLVFVANIVVAWTGTVTLTWTNASVAARGMKAEQYKPSDPAHRLRCMPAEMVAASSTSGVASVTGPTWAAADAVIGSFAVEGDTAVVPSGDADTSGGSWSPIGSVTGTGTTGGAADSNVYAASQYKVLSSALATTWNPLANVSTDASVILLRLSEYDPAAVAKWASVNDDFSTESALWDYAGSGVAAAVGGQLRVTSNVSIFGVATPVARSLVGSSVVIQGFADGGNLGGANSRALWFTLIDASGSESRIQFYWGQGDGGLAAESRPGSVIDDDHARYVFGLTIADYRWLRIGESGGTITWERSGDGVSWTSFMTATVAEIRWAPNLCYVQVASGYSGGEGDKDLYLDNFNLAPTGTNAIVTMAAPVASTSGVGGPTLRTAIPFGPVGATSLVPAPTVAASGVATGFGPVPSTSAVPAPTVKAAAGLGPVPSTSAVGSPTVTASAFVVPAGPVGSISLVGGPTLRAAVPFGPVPATSGVPTPAIQAGANATVTPATVASTSLVPTPAVTVRADANVPAGPVGSVSGVGGPTVVARVPFGPVPSTSLVPTPLVLAGSNTVVTLAAPVASTSAVPAPTVRLRALPATVASLSRVEPVGLRVDTHVPAGPVGSISSVGAPLVRARVPFGPVPATSTVPTPLVAASAAFGLAPVASVSGVPTPTLSASATVMIGGPVPAVSGVPAVGLSIRATVTLDPVPAYSGVGFPTITASATVVMGGPVASVSRVGIVRVVISHLVPAAPRTYVCLTPSATYARLAPSATEAALDASASYVRMEVIPL